MVTEKDIENVLKEVKDPEIGIDVVNLGFIYGIEVEDNRVEIEMTLTVPGCPMHSAITRDVKNKVSELEGVEEVEVNMVFDPPWSPEKMSDKAKEKLGY
ncbi:MAG: metal-sulfur cluster assembly factor [Candidatus Aenigmatarchaeota archaeon]